MRYVVIIRRTSTGYSADAPDVLGCIATGLTVEHTKHMISEALEFHFESMAEDGESIPTPSAHFNFSFDDDSGEEFCTWVDVNVPSNNFAPTETA